MSSTGGLMDTEAGGESGQYEGDLGLGDPSKKSGGQLGSVETTSDPSKTADAAQEQADRGERTAENIRYGQGISEGGMGGMTTSSSGEASQEGFGQVDGQSGEGDATHQRSAEGYGGEGDMDKSIGG